MVNSTANGRKTGKGAGINEKTVITGMGAEITNSKELNAKGIATEPVRLDDYTGKKMTFFHDPDNLPLEIHE